MMFHCHLGLLEGNGYNRADCFWGQCQCLTMISLKAGELSNDVVGTVGTIWGQELCTFHVISSWRWGREEPQSPQNQTKNHGVGGFNFKHFLTRCK